jgi:hypothetical protein
LLEEDLDMPEAAASARSSRRTELVDELQGTGDVQVQRAEAIVTGDEDQRTTNLVKMQILKQQGHKLL